MATLLEQLEGLRTLRPNWDGYNADAPIPEILELARDFVAFFDGFPLAAGRVIQVYATRVGGVQFEWEDERFERELELNPDGSIAMLHVNRATGAMKEERFEPGRGAISPGLLPRLLPNYAPGETLRAAV
ncbi:MAG TPA: hypothetical protein VD866_28935 [Urbifossiella sp.]|nr:hypothetical protein [Urbifossiella sp.]